MTLLIDHNRLHAADVLHAVYYLTSQPIDNFCQVPLDLIEHYDNLLANTSQQLASKSLQSLASKRASDEAQQEEQSSAEMSGPDDFVPKLHNHIVAVVVAAAAAAADSELPFGIMGANLTALEVMALYTSAAMHDFQHPGRTNSFLVATNSPLVSAFPLPKAVCDSLLYARSPEGRPISNFNFACVSCQQSTN